MCEVSSSSQERLGRPSHNALPETESNRVAYYDCTTPTRWPLCLPALTYTHSQNALIMSSNSNAALSLRRDPPSLSHPTLSARGLTWAGWRKQIGLIKDDLEKDHLTEDQTSRMLHRLSDLIPAWRMVNLRKKRARRHPECPTGSETGRTMCDWLKELAFTDHKPNARSREHYDVMREVEQTVQALVECHTGKWKSGQ